MRLDSDLLWRVLSATGRAVALRGDSQGEITVPNALVGVFPAIGPVVVGIPLAGAGNALRESSWISNVVQQGPATGGQTVTVLTLGRGLWRLTGHFMTITDFAAPITGGQNSMEIVDPRTNAQSQFLVATNPVANVPFVLSFDYELATPADGFFLQITTVATAAAQNLNARLTVLANRLL